jgi:hypothetical protein
VPADTQSRDERAVIVQAGRRFEVFCSMTANAGDSHGASIGLHGRFNPLDGDDAPNVGLAALELPSGSIAEIRITHVELLPPRFGEFSVTSPSQGASDA